MDSNFNQIEFLQDCPLSWWLDTSIGMNQVLIRFLGKAYFRLKHFFQQPVRIFHKNYRRIIIIIFH
jgi:hypothetical protein